MVELEALVAQSALNLLPDNVVSLLLELVPANQLGELAQHCVGVEHLSGGLSNQNYLLKCQFEQVQKSQVLRVNQADAVWCSRQDEVASWRHAQEKAIAPKLHFYSDNYEIYLSDFITETTPWNKAYHEYGVNTPRQSELLIGTSKSQPVMQLLNVLKVLSTLPLPEKKVSIQQQWQEYQLQLTDSFQYQTAEWQHCFKQINNQSEMVKQWFYALEECLIAPTFCHRDLTPFNLLLNTSGYQSADLAKLICIDFEYAATSHPLVDLASILATHSLSTQQTDTLLQAYFQWQAQTASPSLNDNAAKCVAYAINCYWLFCAMWALLMARDNRQSFQPLYHRYYSLIDFSSPQIRT
ncbi:aminoglycoside phosphotransferase family protein [Shewanella sp. OMA3-2]|uniref:aminoglycoside phosphotransferase family protein n=1 Tax=Shewanella sp. OMA3-2 TaxID=2908650 RepID=UPI001F368C09|nr:aminoglycoside phosphotransferase family protein [Shewanella sp. OMA3-2]UJF23341.1 aminoglycoside phosphotransferase family protein [Shewanella sp. OMA3-2]